MSSVPLSILDLAQVLPGESVADGLAATVTLAQQAEAWGYRRIWYAEHHNMPTIASSATAVLIAHVAANTSSSRLGSGGVMLPNHSPLVIAEQFGTLAELHPGRIDLGLGRAPGTDQVTVRALRREPACAHAGRCGGCGCRSTTGRPPSRCRGAAGRRRRPIPMSGA